MKGSGLRVKGSGLRVQGLGPWFTKYSRWHVCRRVQTVTPGGYVSCSTTSESNFRKARSHFRNSSQWVTCHWWRSAKMDFWRKTGSSAGTCDSSIEFWSFRTYSRYPCTLACSLDLSNVDDNTEAMLYDCHIKNMYK